MENETKKGSNKAILYVIIAIIVIAALAAGGYFLVKGNNNNNDELRNTTISAENYEEVLSKIDNQMAEQDDAYYFTYAGMYYIMKDGLAAGTAGNNDESAIYANIYGKTVQQLIDEGKQLMEQENVTLEQFKEQVNNLSNSVK